VGYAFPVLQHSLLSSSAQRIQMPVGRTIELRAGDTFPHARSGHSLSVAPVRNDKQIANMWRVWTQGDEIYLATRNATKIFKVSLHSGGNWFVHLGGGPRQNLGPSLPLSLPGWSHAVELSFLVGEDTLPPKNFVKVKPRSRALLVRTPSGSKLLVDVLLAPRGVGQVAHLPKEMNGTRLMNATLRDGTGVVVIGRVAAMTSADYAKIDEVRGPSGVQVHTDRPMTPGESVVEIFGVQPNVKGGGNVIQIVPLGPECFVSP
jgi:hypothetical protein